MAKNVIVTTTDDATTRHLRKVNVLDEPVAGTSLPQWTSIDDDGLNTFETVVSTASPVPGLLTAVIAEGEGGGGESGVGVTPARYWRVVTTHTTQNAAIIAEIQLRETVSGADVTGSGTAGESGHSGTDVAASAVDNSAATHWWSDANLGVSLIYWSYDFGAASPKNIAEIVIQAHSGNAVFTPRGFHIQRSPDNATWTTIWGERSMTAWVAGESRTFTRPADGLTMYGNPGSTGSRTGEITITTNVVMGLGLLTGLINGNTRDDTQWWNAGQSTRQVTFDFGVGASRVIDEFMWYQDSSATNGTWVMEGSNDNSAYTTFAESFALGTGAIHTVTLTNSTGYRYYRLRQTAGVTSNAQYIREIEFKIKDA